MTRLALMLLERLVATPGAAVTWDDLLDCTDRSFVPAVQAARRLREIEAAIRLLTRLLDADPDASARIHPAEPHGFVYAPNPAGPSSTRFPFSGAQP